MELDHIQPVAEDGPHNIENAIAVCFDCHAEIHAYNNKHPKGRKFSRGELRLHKSNWLAICEQSPSVLVGNAGRSTAGPLEAMLDEIQFNIFLAENGGRFCGFLDDQFRRATAAGALSILSNDVRESVFECYGFIHGYRAILEKGIAHMWDPGTYAQTEHEDYHPLMEKHAFDYKHGVSKIKRAHEALLAFMNISSRKG